MNERIKKFLAKPEKIVLEGEDIDIYPLKLKDIDLLMDMQDKEKQSKALKQIIAKTLEQSFPGVTQEEIDNFSVKHFQKLTDAILKVNGLEDKKKQD